MSRSDGAGRPWRSKRLRGSLSCLLSAVAVLSWADDAPPELSPEHRAVIELTYYQGHSCQEIAEIMGRPVGTVKTRLLHARHRLKTLLGSCFEGEVWLRECGAPLVDGPTEVGAYMLALPRARMTAAEQALKTEHAVVLARPPGAGGVVE
jgi:Sigma-70, region 4